MRTRHATFAAVTAVLLMVSTAASAYVLLSPARRWFPADLARAVTVDAAGMASVTDGDNGVSRTITAIERWGGSLINGVAGNAAYVLGDGVSDMVFADPRNICTGTCLAATTVGYYSSSQQGCVGGVLTVVRYTDSDVAFNTRYAYTTQGEPDGCSGEFYLESVATHEVGHLLGLGHSNSSGALMYPSISSCQNKGIASDDSTGINALYGGSFATGACGGGGGTCGDPGDSCKKGSDCCSGACSGRGNGKTCQ